MQPNISFWLAVCTAALISVSAHAAVPQLQTLHSFVGGTDGRYPAGSLIEDASGNLYGTTLTGGSTSSCFGLGVGCGIVFEMSPPKARGGVWKETILYRFTGGGDGAEPNAGLIFDAKGNLYGTTTLGGDLSMTQCTNGFSVLGCGVVFELSPQQNGAWTETPIYTFEGASDGAYPMSNLVFDALGNLYGTASGGGGVINCNTSGLPGCGTVFELTPNGSGGWIETTLLAFGTGSDGILPYAGLIFDNAGNLYGTTLAGGEADGGTVFELMEPTGGSSVWTESVLHSFTSDGAPHAGVIFDQAENLYGATSGINGTVFELTPSIGGAWNFSTIYTFGSGETNAPWGTPTMDNAGNLYGTASGKYCGGVYRLEKKDDMWNGATLDFSAKTKGPCFPEAALTFGKWGAAYGTSSGGGTGTVCGTHGCGTVFAILP